ncbi:MAG: phosphoribosyltransferase [Halobacteriota archaeon]
MQDKFSCLMVDWNYAYDLCRDVSEGIRATGFMPEVIVGVARGGWYLARVLCDFFLLKDLLSLKMEHWGVTATIMGTAALKYGFDAAAIEQLKSKRVLIADDVTDTGDSIKFVIEYVKSLDAGVVKTATLHHKTSSPFKPDFYGECIKDWKWVVYPWSIHEDIMDLVQKVLVKDKWTGLAEIITAMKDEFDLYIPNHLLKEVLANMEFHGKIKSKEELGTELWLLP